MLKYPLWSCMSMIAVCVCCQVGAVALAQDHQPEHEHHHDQMSVEQYIARLEDPKREE